MKGNLIPKILIGYFLVLVNSLVAQEIEKSFENIHCSSQ